MTLPQEHSTRTLAISETPLTSLLDEHQEAQEVQEVQEAQENPITHMEDPTTHTEDPTTQERYHSLILSPYNPEGT